MLLAVGCLAWVPVARAGWSRPLRVLGSRDFQEPRVAFDSRGGTWVAWLQSPYARGAMYVASLSGDERLTGIHVIPGTRSEIIGQSIAFAVDPSGHALIAWTYQSGYGPSPRGTAALTWRLGSPAATRIQLVPQIGAEPLRPAVATNRYGTTVLVYGTGEFPRAEGDPFTTRVDAAWFQRGRLVRRQAVAVVMVPDEALGETDPLIAPLPNGLFEAAWGPFDRRDSGVDTTRSDSSGMFAPTLLSRLPLKETPQDADVGRQLFMNSEGDQLVVWVPEEGRGPYGKLQLSSRRASGGFGPPHTIGLSDNTNTPAVATQPHDRFTVGLEQEHDVLVAAGRFGGPVSPPRRLAAGRGSGGLKLAVTSRGETIATWWLEPRPEEGLIQGAVSKDGLRFGKPATLMRTTGPRFRCTAPGALWPDPRGGVLVPISCSNPHSGFEYLVHYQP